MNGTVASILLLIVTVAIVIAAICFVKLARQLTRTAAAVEGVAATLRSELFPRLERVLDRAEAGLGEFQVVSRSLQNVADGADLIVGTVHEVVVACQRAVSPGIEAIRDISGHIRQVEAALVGVKTGLAAWNVLRKRDA
ncbi:MAG TPA: hypothetical protein PLL30_02205 [Candidatus Krumholzibacteria bacterium]|nr:hypothetical protein [Candidatus Krumholzibacteria bacterium]HPD70580.1 hypothetical protein [Candidatus Krumholzibacteria bacterium]HRY39720.1 hypothetical protein [Candidatus Krumholzibacteria bacterium]